MFNVYFSGSYFPAGWGSDVEPLAPGAIAATIAGVGSMNGAIRGLAQSSLAAGGFGELSGDLEAVQGGTGEMGMVALGSGSMLATIQAEGAPAPDTGGGWWSSPPAPRRRVFGDLAMVCVGSGGLAAAGVVSGIVDVSMACTSIGGMVATMAITERQEIHGFSLPTFNATRKAPRPGPVAPVAVFRPVVYADAAMVCAGVGSMVATGTVDMRAIPQWFDDSEEIALALLMLGAA